MICDLPELLKVKRQDEQTPVGIPTLTLGDRE